MSSRMCIAYASDLDKESTFRKLWSLKEAYTKARGDGLAFEFNKCEFTIAPPHLARSFSGGGQDVEVCAPAPFPLTEQHESLLEGKDRSFTRCHEHAVPGPSDCVCNG